MKKTSFSASSFFLGINRFIGRLVGVVAIGIIGHITGCIYVANDGNDHFFLWLLLRVNYLCKASLLALRLNKQILLSS